MSAIQTTSWRHVRAELLRRINERVWSPGDAIPNEADLAVEFDCARTTVNRALRDLADNGLVTRKRRAGTRVALNPVARATLRIPIMREEIEAKGLAYRHTILEQAVARPPSVIRQRLDLPFDAKPLHIVTMHLADGRPYVLDDRWINLMTVPTADSADFTNVSPNEWLIQNAPYTHGDIAISAEDASASEADHLGVPVGTAILVLERSTWHDHRSITMTRLAFLPGHRIHTRI
ncbi:MAG: GntR family transcriptional regulator [Pseudomonadota bacterium]